MTAGYSGTPLVKKLGVTEASSVVVLKAPKGWSLGVPAATRLSKAHDVIVGFCLTRADLEQLVAKSRPAMAPACGLWVAWPKKASKVPTEVTENLIREVALPTGLVDNKVCAIDEVWSGLRLVIRRELR